MPRLFYLPGRSSSPVMPARAARHRLGVMAWPFWTWSANPVIAATAEWRTVSGGPSTSALTARPSASASASARLQAA